MFSTKQANKTNAGTADVQLGIKATLKAQKILGETVISLVNIMA